MAISHCLPCGLRREECRETQGTPRASDFSHVRSHEGIPLKLTGRPPTSAGAGACPCNPRLPATKISLPASCLTKHHQGAPPKPNPSQTRSNIFRCQENASYHGAIDHPLFNQPAGGLEQSKRFRVPQHRPLLVSLNEVIPPKLFEHLGASGGGLFLRHGLGMCGFNGPGGELIVAAALLILFDFQYCILQYIFR